MRALLLVAGIACAVAAAAEDFPQPRVVSIGDRVHVFLGPIQHANPQNQGYMVNATLIVGDLGAILVDTGGSDEVGRHLAFAARTLTSKRITHVVNTHAHGDHYLGNIAFRGATILSSEACRKRVTDSGHEWVAIMEDAVGHPLPGTRAVAASTAYPPGLTAQSINGVRFVFWVPRGSHTDGDLVVYLPDDKVVIAGDVLVNGVVPTLQDGFLRDWIRTLDEMASLEATHFVPGHGDLMTRRDVLALRDSLSRFRSGVEAGYRMGLGESEIRKVLDLSAWEKLERSHVIGRNINRAWLEAEKESFDEKPGKPSAPARPSPSSPSPTSPH